MKRFLPIIIIFLLIQGCNEGIPKEIIQPDKMEKVLFDIHVVDGYLITFINQDTVKIIASSYYNGIYKKFGIDSAIYNKSMDYYYSHPLILDKIYAGVEKKFNLENAKYDKKNAAELESKNKKPISLVVLVNIVTRPSGLQYQNNPFDFTLSLSRL